MWGGGVGVGGLLCLCFSVGWRRGSGCGALGRSGGRRWARVCGWAFGVCGRAFGAGGRTFGAGGRVGFRRWGQAGALLALWFGRACKIWCALRALSLWRVGGRVVGALCALSWPACCRCCRCCRCSLCARSLPPGLWAVGFWASGLGGLGGLVWAGLFCSSRPGWSVDPSAAAAVFIFVYKLEFFFASIVQYSFRPRAAAAHSNHDS